MSNLICSVKPCGMGEWHVAFENANPVRDWPDCIPSKDTAEKIAAHIMGSLEMEVEYSPEDGNIWLQFYDPINVHGIHGRLEHLWPVIEATGIFDDPSAPTAEDVSISKCMHGVEHYKFCDECAWGWVHGNVGERIPL